MEICTTLPVNMEIANIVTKFQNFEIFDLFLKFLTGRLVTPATWQVLSIRKPVSAKTC